MNFINFTGYKKTNNSILEKIKQISNNETSLHDNLNSLSIFDTLTFNKTRSKLDVKLQETKNSIKMKINSAGSKNLNIRFPNVFGNGENISISGTDLNNYKLELGTPLVGNTKIYNTKICLSRNTKSINEKELNIKKTEISARNGDADFRTGMEEISNIKTFYTRLVNFLPIVRSDIKMGYNREENKFTPFCKVILERAFSLSNEHVFLASNFRIGQIFGKTSLLERFFLGDNLGGYKDMAITPLSQNKKLGGNSIIEIRNKAGFFVNKFQIFGFFDVGVNSVKGLRECSDILTAFGDNNCIGKSTGIGLSLRDRKGPSFIFSVPLTTNPEAEKYSFGIDYEF